MTIRGRLPYWAVLVFLFVLGLAFLIVRAWQDWAWDRGVLTAIGTALLIASALGATIDRWMKTEIAANVFHAAFGYFMPEEFQAEIRRITSTRFMSDACRIIYDLTKITSDTVSVRMRVERVFHNITNMPIELSNSVHMDEWGFVDKSAISRCDIFNAHGILLERISNVEERDDSTLFCKTEPVIIQPGVPVSMVVDYTQMRRINDHVTDVFLTPIKNPEITVNIPEGEFEFLVDFGVINQDMAISSITTTRTLNGTYFPPGHIRFRWWPKRLPNQDAPARSPS